MWETLTVSSIWGIATRTVAAAGDTAAAVEYYRLAAGVGHASALFSFGVCCNIGNCVAEDKAAAVEYNRRSADTGDASALFNVGFSTTSATPLPRTRGRRWSTAVARPMPGVSAPYTNWGFCYDKGIGVAEGKAAAVELPARGRCWGYSRSGRVGSPVPNGDGIAEDKAAAVDCYRDAADSGDDAALSNFGVC
jgi:uncharacterized protein